jgi:peptidoglycan/xylan/chitin deacetylase (PgdA/CDA1 family)
VTPIATGRPFPILLYHSLSVEASRVYRPYAVDPGRFREQMELVAGGGYRTLTVRELVTILADPSGRLPERSVLVTFDDGFDDVHREALPVLDRLGLRATAFIVTGFLGGTSRWLAGDGEGDRRLLSWTQIRELAGAGIEIGSHSHTHPQLDTLRESWAEEEIRQSRTLLEDGLGAAVTSFAYPYGYHTGTVRALLRRHGYTAGCAVKHALSHDRDDPWALGRAVVSAGTSDEQFTAWLEGRGLPVAWSGERPQTVVWRCVRRVPARFRQSGPRPGPTA